MNFPFSLNVPNMDRFNFLSRGNNNNNNTGTSNCPNPPPPGPHPALTPNYNPFGNSNANNYGNLANTTTYDDRFDDDDDDRAPLSPRIIVHNNDLESGRRGEMSERRPISQRFRFRPSFLSVASTSQPAAAPAPYRGRFPIRPRPTSSHYSGAGLRGAPGTVVNGDLESPKSPDFRIRDQDFDLPSTRLHLPNLARTWTQGSNGPPTRPATGRHPSSGGGGGPEINLPAAPEPALLTSDRQRRDRHGRTRSGDSGRSGRRGHRREGSDRSRRSNSSREETPDERRRRRRDRERRRRDVNGTTSTSTSTSSSSSSSRRRRGPPPKNFLFCFPWIQSRRIRSQILRCFVSGMFLALILAVYLSLSLTKNIQSSEFTILLIILILFVTIFFCHSLIRLCMLVVKGRKGGDSDSGSNSSRSQLPEMQQSGPQCGGYAIPREPIRVVLARDEEAAGIESEATKTGPPAYGLWRESVRVDPNRIYWMRNQAASVSGEESEDFTEGSSDVSSLSSSSDSGRAEQTGDASTTRAGAVPRPPSYASDDGISYVVEARPRSTVLPPMATRRTMPSVRDTTYSAAGLHPAEAGRAGQPAAW